MKRGSYQPMLMGLATSLGLLVVATFLHAQNSPEHAVLPETDLRIASTR